MLAPQAAEVDLDADLEQQQDDADVGQQLDLVAVGDVAGRERRDREAGREVADDGRQPELARDPAERRREQQRQADVEQEVGRLHGPSIAAGRTGEPRNQRARRRCLRARRRDEVDGSGLELEVALDRGQLLGRALDLGALEPVLRRDEVPDRRAAEDDEEHDRGVVEGSGS